MGARDRKRTRITVGRAHRLADGTITKRRKPAGPKTRKDYILALRVFFRWCVTTKRGLTENPADNIIVSRVYRRQMRALTITEILLNSTKQWYPA